MSMFVDRIPRHELGTKYRYKGWFLGIVPCYIDDPSSEAPVIVERNGVPTWAFLAALLLHELFCRMACALSDDFVPEFFVRVTGTLEAQS